jgi:hypothetical protein
MTNAAGVEYAVVRGRVKAPYGYYVTRSEADGVCATLTYLWPAFVMSAVLAENCGAA